MDPILIGYSINMLNEDFEWTQDRRLIFLIDPLTKLPKSVDSNVWEESYDYLKKISEQEMMDNWTKWRSKDRLIELTEYSTTDENRVLVASYLHFFDYVPTEVWAMEYRSEPVDNDLIFLGYDVANGGTLSGLSNCGFTDAALEYCRENYSQHLNQHGLFEDFGIANDFLGYTNQRTPADSPFYVYSLYTDKIID